MRVRVRVRVRVMVRVRVRHVHLDRPALECRVDGHHLLDLLHLVIRLGLGQVSK